MEDAASGRAALRGRCETRGSDAGAAPATLSRPGADVEVVSRIGVPLGTVRLAPMVDSHHSTSPVLNALHWLQMVRVHARAIATEVVEFEPFGDLPLHQPIGDTVTAFEPGTDSKHPVSVPIARCRPLPAFGVLTPVDLRPESLRFGSSTKYTTAQRIAMALPPVVVRDAPPAPVMGSRTNVNRARRSVRHTGQFTGKGLTWKVQMH